MARSKTPTYIVEFQLSASSADVREVHVRFDALRNLYNAVLSQLFKRLAFLKKTTGYQAAITEFKAAKTVLKRLEKAKKKAPLSASQKKEEKAAEKKLNAAKKSLKKLNNDYDLSDYATHAMVARHVKACSYFSDHLDSHTVQTIATRAYTAFSDWRFKGKGKPRFKSWRRGIHSTQGKSKSCLRFMIGNEKKPTHVAWNGLAIPVRLDLKDKSGFQADALEQISLGKWKFCRIISRVVKGKAKLYAQVAIEGTPYIKPKHREMHALGVGKTVGLDHGPSTIAAVSEDAALLRPINECTKSIQAEIARLQRQQSRRLRLANPQNFEVATKKKGRKTITTYRVKKGARDWVRSEIYRETQKKIKELHRLLAARRKQSHDVLATEVVSMGNHVQNENLSHKALQKMFGKSVGANAPSALMSTIQREAEKAGGEYVKINPWQAKLSQYDHVNDDYVKKPLSQRIHLVGGEIPVQRDLYSAFLAACTENNAVSRSRAVQLWNPKVRRAIEDAETQLIQAASRKALPSSLGVRELRKERPNTQSEQFASLVEIQVPDKGDLRPQPPLGNRVMELDVQTEFAF